MRLCVGVDASGTPDLTGTERRHNPYVVVAAGVQQPEILQEELARTRAQAGMKATQEFHAHALPEVVQVAVVEAGSRAGLCIGALLMDKQASRRALDAGLFPSSAQVQRRALLRLLEAFFARYELAELRYDEEFGSRKRPQELITDIKRLHRAAWPLGRVRVQPAPSHQSDLIQLADVIAYGLGVEARGTQRTKALQELLQRLHTDSAHVFIGTGIWEA